MQTLIALLMLASLAGCSDEPEPEASPTVTATVTASPDGPTTIDFPPELLTPEQGGHYFAVALAADDRQQIDESVAAVARYGYHAGIGDVGCLSGAGDAYGIPSGTIVSYLLFATRRAAYRFTDAYARAEDGMQMGVAEVTTYCLD